VNNSLTKFQVGAVSDIPKRLGKTIRVGETEVAMFRLSNGTIRAIENRCPHKGGVLTEGMVSGDFVFCPLHDWKICLDDGKVQDPDIGCVKTYRTIVEEDQVYLLLDDI
jgi:nitrite reductase (NADH) small subunit